MVVGEIVAAEEPMDPTERAAEGAVAPRKKPDGEKAGPENIHSHFLRVG